MGINELLKKFGEDHLDVDHLESLARESIFGMDNTGVCIACGAERDGCEPDAEGYECEDCGEFAVCGAEQLWMVIV